MISRTRPIRDYFMAVMRIGIIVGVKVSMRVFDMNLGGASERVAWLKFQGDLNGSLFRCLA